MDHADQIRFPKWLCLTVAVVLGFGAAIGCMVYVANGVVIGDIWGLPGREHQIALAQRQGRLGLFSSVLLQFGVVGALFAYMDREDYFVAHIVWAVVLSFAMTVACAVVILFQLKLFR